MNLKIGGSNVGKIMYNGQEFGGATKLEPGTILYISSYDDNVVARYNNELYETNSTVEIIFPNVGKHWEGLKKIGIYSGQGGYNVFDVNSIDEPALVKGVPLKIHRERSLTNEADKLIVKVFYDEYLKTLMITVEE